MTTDHEQWGKQRDEELGEPPKALRYIGCMGNSLGDGDDSNRVQGAADGHGDGGIQHTTGRKIIERHDDRRITAG